MRARDVALIGPALLFAVCPAAAQSWSAAEQAIIDRTVECARAAMDRNREVRLSCYHRTYSGWSTDMPAPVSYDQVVAAYDRNATTPASPTQTGFYVQPVAVRVSGSSAMIHYYFHTYFRHPDGTTETRRGRWTDILTNEGGRWSWIADHGGREDLPS